MKLLLSALVLSLSVVALAHNHEEGKKKAPGHDKEHKHVEVADHAHDDAHHKDHDHKAHHPDHKDGVKKVEEKVEEKKKD